VVFSDAAREVLEQALEREECECRRRFGIVFTNLYIEKGGEDETPDEFYKRCEEQYEFFKEWLDRPDKVGDMDLDEYEEWRTCEDYGLTDDESDADDNW